MGPHSNVGGHAARVIGVIATLALAVFLVIGCGETDTLDPTPSLLATVPVDGSEVAEGDIVTVIFDLDPGIVTVNGAAAQGGGVTRTFQVADHGVQSISWGDGSTATLGYDVTPVDVTPFMPLLSPPIWWMWHPTTYATVPPLTRLMCRTA